VAHSGSDQVERGTVTAAGQTAATVLAPAVQAICGFGFFIGCLVISVGIGLALREPKQILTTQGWAQLALFAALAAVAWDVRGSMTNWSSGVRVSLSLVQRLGGMLGWVLSRGGLAASVANAVGLVAAFTVSAGKDATAISEAIAGTERTAHALALAASLFAAALGLAIRWSSRRGSARSARHEAHATVARRHGWFAFGGGFAGGLAFLGLFVGMLFLADQGEYRKVRRLVAAIREKNETQADQQAGEVIAAHRAYEAGKELLPLLGDDDPDIRRLALRAVGRLGEEAHLPCRDAVLARLTDADDRVRREAVAVLRHVAAPERQRHIVHSAVFHLERQLDSGQSDVRLRAVRSLGEFGEHAAAARYRLEQTARDDTDDNVRAAAEVALGKISP
jgi:hypothetical protein